MSDIRSKARGLLVSVAFLIIKVDFGRLNTADDDRRSSFTDHRRGSILKHLSAN